VKAQALRWARARGLDVSQRDKWRVEFKLVTTGELPPRISTGRQPEFWLRISEAGWWMILAYPFPGIRGMEREASFVSWQKRQFRWHLAFKSASGLAKKPRARAVDKFDPPKSLERISRWLESIEPQLGFAFRRDRPLITSNVKGAAKATFAWLTS